MKRSIEKFFSNIVKNIVADYHQHLYTNWSYCHEDTGTFYLKKETAVRPCVGDVITWYKSDMYPDAIADTEKYKFKISRIELDVDGWSGTAYGKLI